MKTITKLALVFLGCMAGPAIGEELTSPTQKWVARFDIGGAMTKDPSLTVISAPVTGGDTLELSAGTQFDLALGYRIQPWLTLEGEFGFIYNEVDSVGNFDYPNSELWQMLMMANVVFEFPRGPFRPFAGVGAGGVLSTLSFGNYYYYGYDGADGYGTDFVPAFQAFGGVRYQFSDQTSLGVVYRVLFTEDQDWDVEWWYGGNSRIGVDSVCVQSVCLVMTWSF